MLAAHNNDRIAWRQAIFQIIFHSNEQDFAVENYIFVWNPLGVDTNLRNHRYFLALGSQSDYSN